MGKILDKIKESFKGFKEIFISPSIEDSYQKVALSNSDMVLLKKANQMTENVKRQEARFSYDEKAKSFIAGLNRAGSNGKRRPVQEKKAPVQSKDSGREI